MATPVRRLFLWKKLNAVNLAKLGSNCNLQPEEKRQLQKSDHWLLWDKVDRGQHCPAWLEDRTLFLSNLAFHFSVLLIR